MAIYHLNLKTIGRNQGRSATGAAAYRAGEIIVDRRTGLIFDYSKKRGCDGAEILAPRDAPAWCSDRAELFNRIEEGDHRKDAQLLREIEFALPIELDREQMKHAAREFIREQFVARGMVADLAFHRLDSSNPHAHCLLTLRRLTPDGFGPKEREWNDRALCNQWREAWATHANEALAKAGRAERIDHRKLIEQAFTALDEGDTTRAMALDRAPTIHAARDADALAKNEAIRLANLARAAEWEAIEQQARHEARLMHASDDTWPKVAAPSADPAPVTLVGSQTRPGPISIAEADARFRQEMSEASGLKAIQWRAADRRVAELSKRLADDVGEERRRYDARERAERAAATARADRSHFLAHNPQPRNWWFFNRAERDEWARRNRRRDQQVRRATEQYQTAKERADLSAILAIEREREAMQQQLARALEQRKQAGRMPSEGTARNNNRPMPSPTTPGASPMTSERQHAPTTPEPNPTTRRPRMP